MDTLFPTTTRLTGEGGRGLVPPWSSEPVVRPEGSIPSVRPDVGPTTKERGGRFFVGGPSLPRHPGVPRTPDGETSEGRGGV